MRKPYRYTNADRFTNGTMLDCLFCPAVHLSGVLHNVYDIEQLGSAAHVVHQSLGSVTSPERSWDVEPGLCLHIEIQEIRLTSVSMPYCLPKGS